MNIVRTSNRWLNRLYKTAAILLVLLAVVISAFRLFLPYVHHYKQPLENYINESSQANITIGSLSMTWQGSGPALVIGNINVFNTENASVFITQLELQVDFWRTLTEQNLITKTLILSGVKADVSEHLWNSEDEIEQEDQALVAAKKDNETEGISIITDVFLNRISGFSIRDSQITVKNNNISRTIQLNQLHWLNNNDRHQAQGSVVLNGLSSNNLQVKIDLTGGQGNDLSGQIYLQANQIDITPWLDNILMLDDDKTKTDINFSAWLAIKHSDISRIQVDFLPSNMYWFDEQERQELTFEQGQLLLVKGSKEHSFNLYSTPLSLKLNDEPSQIFTTMMAKQGENFSLHLSEIDLTMLAKLSPLLVAKEDTRQLLSEMKLSGKVENLYIRNLDKSLQAVANFSAFTNRFTDNIPGVENVSGALSYADNYLSVNFFAKAGQLDFDKLFIQTFPYDSLAGEFNVAFDEHGWALTVDELEFLSEEINLSTQVKVAAPTDGDVNLSLLAHISNGNAGLVGRYLPLPIMSEDLVSYLNAAVVSGRVEDAQVLINGPIGHFPFNDGSGIFVVDAELSEAEFKFVEDWPAITDFAANLNFTNNSMMITGRGGLLTGLDVTGVQAGIADLAGEQILTVDADIKPTPTSYISDLINQSPLEDSVGSVLEQLQVAGQVSGEFHLNLPLNDDEQTLASGSIHFANNDVALQSPAMNFSEVQGQLNFANDKIDTENLKLSWHGLPVGLDIIGQDKTDYYDTDIKLTALWQEDKWLSHVPEQLKRYTKGSLSWQGDLSLHQHHQGGFSYNGNFSSNLKNTQLTLPSPYERTPQQENDLAIEISGETAKSKLVVNYGDKLFFSGLLDHDSTSFTRANLMLGEGVMALPNDGFHITTKLEEAEFAQWQPLISDILDSINEPSAKAGSEVNDKANETPLLAKPKRIRGSIAKLNILGQALNNVSFNLLDKSQWWLLQFNAQETRSQIKIYPDWINQGLEINAEFLKLPVNDIEEPAKNVLANHVVDKTENDIIFANIPPVKFHCDSCAIGALSLGVVDVDVNRLDAQTIEFKNFKASRDKSELTLSGQWLHNDNESTTSLSGQLSVADIEAEMQALSFDSIIKDSGAKLDINFNWLGGLHDFSLTDVNGEIKAKLDDGYLKDISDKGARLFSVLSLQSLVRKLTLDFRDIFSDGMFYSSITGDYQLQQGILTTENTKMNGTAGNLFMTGHTDLISGELAYDMSYKPNLTSSLPVLGWILTLDPVTFLAGVAIDQVIKSQVVSEFKFELSGTIDNPTLQEVNRKSKNISVDAALPLKGEQLKDKATDKPPSVKATVNNKVIDD
ncbi:YhdP family protein [Colwelliaceae bacterium MEBiC 14330]